MGLFGVSEILHSEAPQSVRTLGDTGLGPRASGIRVHDIRLNMLYHPVKSPKNRYQTFQKSMKPYKNRQQTLQIGSKATKRTPCILVGIQKG